MDENQFNEILRSIETKVAPPSAAATPPASEPIAAPDGTRVQPAPSPSGWGQRYKGGWGAAGKSVTPNSGPWIELKPNPETDIPVVSPLSQSVLTGSIKSIFESGDLIFGETPKEERSSFRTMVEEAGEEQKRLGWGYGLAQGVSQFATSMIGVGKIAQLIRVPTLAARFGIAGRVGFAAGEGMLANNLAFDPREDRISDLIEAHPPLSNPVTRYLKADPNDTEAEARLKLSLEGAGLDLAVAGIFALGLKVWKLRGTGDVDGAAKASDELSLAVRAHEERAEGLRTGSDEGLPQPNRNNAGATTDEVDAATRATMREGDEYGRAGPQSTEGLPAANRSNSGRTSDNFTDPAVRSALDEPAGYGRADGRQGDGLGEPNRSSLGRTSDDIDGGGARLNAMDEGVYSSRQAEGGELPAPRRDASGETTDAVDAATRATMREGEDYGRADGTRSADLPGGDRNANAGRASESADDPAVRATMAEGADYGQAPGTRPAALPEGSQSNAGRASEGLDDAATRATMREGADYGRADSRRGGDLPGENRTAAQGRTTDGAVQELDPVVRDTVPPADRLRPPQFAQIVARTEADTDAILRAGSYDEAVASGHAFTPANDALPMVRLNVPQEVEALTRRTFEAMEGRLEAAKGGDAEGVLSDPAVEAMIRRRIALYNEDPLAIIGAIQKAGQRATTLVAEMGAADVIASKVLQQAYLASKQFLAENFGAIGGTALTAEKHIKELLGTATSLISASRSISTAGGRIVRRSAGSFMPTEQMIADLNRLPVHDLVQRLAASEGNLPLLVQAASQRWWRGAIDRGNFIAVNGLLSSPMTHLRNAVGNLAHLMVQPAAQAAGSFSSAAWRQALQEYRYMGSSIADALKFARQAWAQGDSVLAPGSSKFETRAGMNTADIAQRPFVGMDGSVEALTKNLVLAFDKTIGLPLRGTQAMDELFAQVAYRSKVMAKAVTEGEAKGLQGAELREFVERESRAAFGPDGEALKQDVLHEARAVTFNQDLPEGSRTAKLNEFAAKFPEWKLPLVFLRSGHNILMAGMRFTPPLSLLQSEYRAALSGSRGPEARALAVGQALVGTAVMTFAAWAAANGRLTGGGPPEGPAKQAWLGTGAKPYAWVSVNDDGSYTFTPLSSIEPFGLALGIVADLTDIAQHPERYDDVEKIAAAALLSIMRNVKNRLYFEGLADTLGAIFEPERKAEQFGERAVQTIYPYSALLRQFNNDTIMRDVRGMADAAMAITPGLSAKLPAKHDAFGEPITVQRGLWSRDKASLAHQELARLALETGDTLGAASPMQKGVDLRDVTTTDGRNAYEVYQGLTARPQPGRKALSEAVADLILSERYAKAYDGPDDMENPGSRLSLIGYVVQQYREQALGELVKDPNVRSEMVAVRVRQAQSAKGVKPTAPMSGLQNLLQGFGLTPASR